MFEPEDKDFLARKALQVVYRTPSGAIIALNPEIELPRGESPCSLTPPIQSK